MIKWLVAPKVDDGLAVEGLWEQVDWRDLYGGEGAFFDKAFEIARQGGRVAAHVGDIVGTRAGDKVDRFGGEACARLSLIHISEPTRP